MARSVACVILLVFATAAWGGRNLIINGNFASGSVANTCNVYDLLPGSNILTGWTVSVGSIDWEGPPPCGWVGPPGQQYSVDLVGQLCIGGIEQTIDTNPGSLYVLSFELAGNPGGNPPAIKPLTVTVDGKPHPLMFDTGGKDASNMGWRPVQAAFRASGSRTTISFVSDVSGFGGPCNAGAAIANVRVERL
ncbi:MAG TPA: DUF642 domain-containing protein [Casimicrobiaceae bacterium]|nr:DUF642 domain-containing protein [Casimicrobiaceae bacterium]